MEPHLDFIVKLGGSAITRKDQLECARVEQIKLIANVLNACRKTNRRFLVVHGAGSFGHHQAKEFGVNKGYVGCTAEKESSVKKGFCKTRLSVCKLNQLVVNEFVASGLPAVALSPCGGWVTHNGEVIADGCQSVKALLQANFVPVLHGDCVLDTAKGCHILSGDIIIKILCAELKPRWVVFLSDVLGIYDKPPIAEDAQLLPVIRVTPDGTTDVSVTTSVANHDVTGGIQTKLTSAIDIVRHSEGSVPVFICAIDSTACQNTPTNCRSSRDKRPIGSVIAVTRTNVIVDMAAISATATMTNGILPYSDFFVCYTRM
ncbi:Isopentenyl phosphate kinase [Lamellibrachia satsuma]|nr:Isopentenyl phosphate kinase [Lamellibrachia satsuma]